jgi:type I restriction enzyme S subunit
MTWPTKKLSEVAYFQEGPGLRTFQFKPNGIRVINVANIHNGFLDLTETKFLDPDEVKQKYKHFLVNENDILVSTSGTIGRVAWVKKQNLPLMLNTSVVRFHTLNEKILSNKFLFYFLSSSLFKNEILKYKTGVAIFNVGPSHIKRIKIPLPPLNIQQKIVERLDAIKKAQELNDKQIELAEELFQSLLHRELDPKGKNWEIKRLGELFDITSSKRVFESEWKKQGVPFYRAREIVSLVNNQPIENPIFISEEMYEKYKQKYGVPQEGDVLVTGVGTIGVSYVVKKADKFYFKDGNIIWLKRKPNSTILSLFVDYFFQTTLFKHQIRTTSAGATVLTYTIQSAKKTKIPLPPLETQRKIIEKLSAVQEYKKKLLDQKQKLQELFESVLNKSFKGELVG